MMKKLIFFLLIFTILYMLFLDKNEPSNLPVVEQETENPLLVSVLNTALTYKGTNYKFGGTTKEGMDCSGLVYTSYKKIGRTLARSSKNMFYEGEEVLLKDVKKGDLLFFDIDTFEEKVNHVGMITSVDDFEIKFIHSTTQKGVIITSINESYWKKAFIKAKRIID